jgi:hypothetical protein
MDLDSLIKRLAEVREKIDNVEVLCDEGYLIFRDPMGGGLYEETILINFDYDHEHLSALTAKELEAKKIEAIKDESE